MFGLFREQQRWDVTRIKENILSKDRDFLRLDEKKREELLTKIVIVILSHVHTANRIRLEPPEIVAMELALEESMPDIIEDILRRNIKKFDKEVEKAMNEFIKTKLPV